MNILKDLLSLYAESQEISINLIPEFFLFSSGKKNLLRFSVEYFDLQKIESFANRHSLHYDYASFYVNTNGNNWSTLVSESPKEQNLNFQKIYIATIGKKKTLVKNCLDAEINFDFEKAGIILGYPDCCVRAYPEIDNYKEKWVSYYFNKHPNSQQNYLNNRTASVYGYGSFIGEFFPCSLECLKTREISATSERLMKINGYFDIQKLFKSHSKTPIYLNDDETISNTITKKFIYFKSI